LADCLESSTLSEVYANHCTTVSLADFLVIAGEAVMARTSFAWPEGDDKWVEGGGPYAVLDNFKFGRTSAETCDQSGQSLMPNPELGCVGLKDIFIDHIYKAQGAMAWNLTAAISGAHTLGSASIENSGYNGFWDGPEEAGKFNNGYYKSLLFKGWYQELAVDGNPDKNQFKRIDDAMGADHKEMMLSTDMCLAFTANQAAADDDCKRLKNCEWTLEEAEPLLAQTHDCCAWVEPKFIYDNEIYTEDEIFPFCGNPEFQAGFGGGGTGDNARKSCCEKGPRGEQDSSFGDCDFKRTPQGPAIEAIIELASDDAFFLQAFLYSWSIATTNGFDESLTPIGEGQGHGWYDQYFVVEDEDQKKCKVNFKKCFKKSPEKMIQCFVGQAWNWFTCKAGMGGNGGKDKN